MYVVKTVIHVTKAPLGVGGVTIQESTMIRREPILYYSGCVCFINARMVRKDNEKITSILFTLGNRIKLKASFQPGWASHIFIVTEPPTVPCQDLNPRPLSLAANALMTGLSMPDRKGRLRQQDSQRKRYAVIEHYEKLYQT